ncbi:MAG: DUF4199 domain-containing protein [Cellulophaga sp.]
MRKIESQRIYLKYGLLIAMALIAFFLLVRVFGLHENIWLRLFNGVIIGYGIYAVIKKKKQMEKYEFDYFSGFITGVSAGIIATGIFVLFMAVYMFHLDTAFADDLLGNWMGNYNHGPGILVFVLAVEGASSSLILSLTFMQKFKQSKNIAF